MAEDRKRWQDPDKIIQQIAIPVGSVVVDMGCGPGFFTVPLSRKVGSTGKVYAIDADPIMLQHLASNISNSQLSDQSNVISSEADVYESGVPDKCADFVLFANLLHDLKDRERFFEEIDRILKSGGDVVDVDWHKLPSKDMGPPIEKRLSENESRKIIRANGFRIIYALNAGPYHYGFVCNKK